MSRRQFLAATAAGTAGAVVFTGCTPETREFTAQSRVRIAEDIVSAYENWYATTCRVCDAGCGTIVRVIEGRAKKVEGNPDHPLNRGKLCARGQASVQEQYHPDRLQSPMSLRGGRRPIGKLLGDNWDQGLNQLVTQLKTLQQGGRAGNVVVVTPPLRGHRALVVDRFTRGLGARWMTLDVLGDTPMREASRRVLGQDSVPHFDVENAKFVLSIGADFLGNWLSSVNYSVQYGNFRNGSYRAGQAFKPRHHGDARGYLVHASPHFSQTAASADEWVPIKPGTEGLFALSVANALVSAGQADAAGMAAFGGAGGLGAFTPEQTAARTGVAAARVRDIATRLAATKPSLVIGGGSASSGTNGTASVSAILGLNVLLGAVGRAGGVLPNPTVPIDGLPTPPRANPISDWQALVGQMSAGQVSALLVWGCDPVYDLPPALGFREALGRVPFVVSFSSFMTDTAMMADLILPSHLQLEDWGDDLPVAGPGAPVWTIQQPILRPLYDTRGFLDILLAVGEELGGPVAQALPWRTFKDVLRQGADALQKRNAGSVKEPDLERFWVKLLQQGGWWETTRPQPTAGVPATAAGSLGPLLGSFPQPRFAGDAGAYPFHLVIFEHNTLGHGENAHLPWLQATPDPITSVTWQTWVEVNLKVARDLNLIEGDVVRIESEQGAIEVPVYVNPAAAPDVLAIPLGQGHAEYGRWAKDRGANPLRLIAPLADEATGALAYGATRVRMSKTGRRIQVPKFEGDAHSGAPARSLPEESVVKVTNKV